jgi:hypothetical protein
VASGRTVILERQGVMRVESMITDKTRSIGRCEPGKLES